VLERVAILKRLELVEKVLEDVEAAGSRCQCPVSELEQSFEPEQRRELVGAEVPELACVVRAREPLKPEPTVPGSSLG
jgi:hypothetical protein